MAEYSYKDVGRENIQKCIFPPIEQWIKGFMDADFVVTDSFHGTVFSIIFNKPFVAIVNKERGAARFTSLLNMFGLSDRLVYSIDDIEKIYSKSIDYDHVNDVLRSKRIESLEFIYSNLHI